MGHNPLGYWVVD